MREPTIKEIHQACMSYRHDFGLLSPVEQNNLIAESKRWLIAWLKVVETVETAENKTGG